MTENQIMYKVGGSHITKLEVVKVTEKTVLTDKGFRYYKECNSYALFDSFNIAKICAKNYTKNRIESLKSQLVGAESDLRKLDIKTESDLL